MILPRIPQAGNLIPGVAGIRKLRFALPAKAAGGAKADILLADVEGQDLHACWHYAKAKKENLEPEQTALLRHLVKELERHG